MFFITIQGNDWLVLRNIGYYIGNNYLTISRIFDCTTEIIIF